MTDRHVAEMQKALLGHPYPKPTTPAFAGAVEITIVSGTPDGVRFTVDDYSGEWSFGPAPFHRPAAGMVPPPGTKGVAHFSADGSKSWVTALFDWP